MSSKKMNRRVFLQGTAAAVSAVLAAGCGAVRTRHLGGELLGPRATPPVVLPSPVPAQTATPTAEDQARLLDDFLALSALLTGVANLDPQLGRVYLSSLQQDESAGQVETLIEEIRVAMNEGSPTLADLKASGLLDQRGVDTLTGQITKLWYTGIYPDESGEDTVATYVDCLAWQTLRFTKPKTICGYPGFWEEPWESSA